MKLKTIKENTSYWFKIAILELIPKHETFYKNYQSTDLTNDQESFHIKKLLFQTKTIYLVENLITHRKRSRKQILTLN